MKYGADKARELARTAGRIIVMKGKQVTQFDRVKDKPSDDDLLAHLLGPTGNLRAPSLRAGTVLLVGFNEDVYNEVLG